MSYLSSVKQAFKAALIITFLLFLVLNMGGCARQPFYDGELQDGQPHGFGTWKHPGGAYYAGDFVEGLREGRGTWIHPDGIRYAGDWQTGEYHGRGILITSGQRYIGHWHHGIKEGPGVQMWADGRIYRGSWQDNRPHGYGVMQKPDGSSYIGHWREGYRQGEGTAFYTDGSRYSGQWEKDNRHGYGRLIMADGTAHEGEWVNDCLEGEGTLTRADGTMVSAIWSDNELREIPVEGIELDTDRLTLVAGEEEARLTTTIIPVNATGKEITWASSDPEIASVADGLVEPLTPGTALITATTADGSCTASCEVTVYEKVIGVSSIALDRTSLFLRVGETAILIAEILPYDALDQTIHWHSEDRSVALVTPYGPLRAVVTAVDTGQAVITATTADGGHTATCSVSITPQINLEDRIIVPRLHGKTLTEARAILENKGLVTGEISYETHSSAPANQVIRQDPPVGSFVNKGRAVNLVVSSGLPEPESEIQPDSDGTN